MPEKTSTTESRGGCPVSQDDPLLVVAPNTEPLVFTRTDFVRFMAELNAAWISTFRQQFSVQSPTPPKAVCHDISPETVEEAMEWVAFESIKAAGLVHGERAKALGEELVRRGKDVLAGKIPWTRDRKSPTVLRQVGGPPT